MNRILPVLMVGTVLATILVPLQYPVWTLATFGPLPGVQLWVYRLVISFSAILIWWCSITSLSLLYHTVAPLLMLRLSYDLLHSSVAPEQLLLYGPGSLSLILFPLALLFSLSLRLIGRDEK